MSAYVVTVPGTFLAAPPQGTREALVRALRSADPQGTGLGEAQDLDVLTVYPGTPAFSLRLEVEADSAPEAEDRARTLASDALGAAGIAQDTAPLGDPVITGLGMS